MLFKDQLETSARGFIDKRSYVRYDKSEVLYGKDWTARKREIWERGSGHCEKQVEGSGMWINGIPRCKNEMHDPHHIKPRNKGRDDRAENLIGLCRMHHELLDKRKPRFGEKGPIVKRRTNAV